MTGPSDDGQAGVTAQRRHDLADALHDALCNECGAGTGFDFRSADTDKAFAKLIPLLQRWQAEDRAAEREKARAMPRGRCRSSAEHDAHMCDGMPCGDWRDYEQPIGPYTQTLVIDLPGGIQ